MGQPSTARRGGRENSGGRKKRTGAIFAPNLQWTPCGEFYGEISATMHEMPPFPIVSAITDYLRRTIPPTIPISGLLCLPF